MAAEQTASVEAGLATTPPPDAAALPGFYTNPNYVLGDSSATWRFGKPPDYSKTRRLFAETKSMNHEPGSLPQLVENLVKNWEIEASFKTKLGDWRTVNPSKYTFSMNGGAPQKGEHMLEVGSYNSIIAPNEYYSPEHSDFSSSHKTFKRMMPFFAWEVLEVYSGPPKVAFRWRHWGQMKNDYVGFNNRAEKVTAKAHGGWIDIQGITVADLDEDMKITHLETWFDPMDMFRQIAPKGIVNKQPTNTKTPLVSPDGTSHESKADVITSPVSSSQAQQNNQPSAGHGSAGPPLPHESSRENLAASEVHEGGSVLVSEAAKSIEESCAVEGGGIPLPHHEPARPLLPHESDQENNAELDLPDDDVEFLDAHEHPISDLEDKVDDLWCQCEAEGKTETGAEQGVKSKHGPVLGQTVNGKESETASKTSIATEIADPEVQASQSKDDTQIDHTQVGPETMKMCKIESTEPDIAQTKADEGEAVAVSHESVETVMTHEEMSRFTPAECPFFNRE